MKKYLSIILLSIVSLFPLNASAQNYGSFGSFYGVAEAGVTKNSLSANGTFNNLTTDNRTGAAFGGALGYRQFIGQTLILGVEGSIATSNGSSFSQDATSTLLIETDYVYGAHVTLGGRFGKEKGTFIYGLIGFGGTSVDETATFVGSTNTITASENGNGLSIGAAIETGITDNFGIRIKGLYNFYKQGANGNKVRDASVMAGLVFNF